MENHVVSWIDCMAPVCCRQLLARLLICIYAKWSSGKGLGIGASCLDKPRRGAGIDLGRYEACFGCLTERVSREDELSLRPAGLELQFRCSVKVGQSVTISTSVPGDALSIECVFPFPKLVFMGKMVCSRFLQNHDLAMDREKNRNRPRTAPCTPP